MKVYSFEEQLSLGQDYENRIFSWFSDKGFSVIRANNTLQKMGIDAIIERHGFRYSVELKTDFKTRHTGNIFLETISTDTKKGWALTSVSQYILYYCVGLDVLLKFNTVTIKNYLGTDYKLIEAIAKNVTYDSKGLLLPLEGAKAIAATTYGGILNEVNN